VLLGNWKGTAVFRAPRPLDHPKVHPEFSNGAGTLGVNSGVVF